VQVNGEFGCVSNVLESKGVFEIQMVQVSLTNGSIETFKIDQVKRIEVYHNGDQNP